MLKNKLLLLFLFPLWFCSCNKVPVNPDKVIWGTTDYYDNFLFKKYEPVQMVQTLELEFNEDAQRLIKSDIELEPVEKNEKDEFVSAKGIKLYKNGVICKENIFKIKPDEKSVELGIEFTEAAIEGNHTLYLHVKNGAGLNRIDNTDLSATDDIILAHEWVVRKNNVYNPLARLLFWILIAIITVIIILIIIIRANNPTFKIRRLQIEYYNSEGELIPPYNNLNLKGCYKVICTNRKQKQPFLSRIFKGKAVFVVNDFWDKEACLKPKSFSKNAIRIVNNPYDNFVKSVIKGTPTELVNNNNQKVILNF